MMMLKMASAARAASLTSALTSSYGPSGSSSPCGYGTAACTCSSMFLMYGAYTGTIPSDLGNCTSLLFLCARAALPACLHACMHALRSAVACLLLLAPTDAPRRVARALSRSSVWA